MIMCKICNREFKNKKALSTHINLSHQLNSKQYYDNYIKKDNDGICKVCGNPTTFRGLGVGYLKRCSAKCFLLIHSPPINSGLKQDKKIVEKRIKNTNQILKENHRKETMMKKYGVYNYSQTEKGRENISKIHKGVSKPPRTKEHQNKIIKSKMKNGTLKHSEETKKKISNSVSGENNPFKKYLKNGGKIPKMSGGISGYYGKLYFRSSLELAFIHAYITNKFTIVSAENNNYVINYYIDGLEKSYYPDYYITELDTIFEIKPSKLLNYNNNQIKFNEALKKFNNYKVLTEKDIPYLKKEVIDILLKDNTIVLDEKSIKKYERYRH